MLAPPLIPKSLSLHTCTQGYIPLGNFTHGDNGQESVAGLNTGRCMCRSNRSIMIDIWAMQKLGLNDLIYYLD